MTQKEYEKYRKAKSEARRFKRKYLEAVNELEQLRRKYGECEISTVSNQEEG